ncbi:MarR family winged helix-turn-helix transcriptional regulator [Gandjariella thermophila]|uniref:MarR family transcriptional regulator n=1 Tax=Gandjariella thermophila TaxID=1931992 RepID=A0A4D4JDI9_9PSEU|nr:MarR family transcriptional regulator [Gandjariella thermophila]GDY31953.1 MarR family transcriptional regulator [Gandjariella thermophila]
MSARSTRTPAPDLLHLDSQLCLAVQTASRAVGGVYRRLLADLGLTYPQYLVLMALWEHGELTVKRMGELLRLDSGTLSPLLKRLEAAGLVRRERSADDERSVLVTLTAKGGALRERAEQVPCRLLEASGLDENEAVQLREALYRLADALDRSLETP